MKAELPLPPESDSALASMAAAGFGSHVLEDDQCEDEEADQSSKLPTVHSYVIVIASAGFCKHSKAASHTQAAPG